MLKLTEFISQRVPAGSGLRKVLFNASWMVGEQGLRIALSLAVNVWMARYLGPEKFGELSSAVAYGGMFAILAKLGLDRITVRELVEGRDDDTFQAHLVATVWTLRVIAGGGVYALCLLVAWISGFGDFWIVAIVSASIVFAASDCVDLVFQARVEARRVVVVRSGAFFCTSGFKLLLLVVRAPLVSFVWAALLDFVVASLALLHVYRTNYPMPLKLRIEWLLARRLLSESWPEILAGFSGLLFIRLDQVMLRAMSGAQEAGIFAVAARLSETWYFVPVALISSTFPSIVRYRLQDPVEYMRRLQKLMIALAILSYLVILTIHLLAHPMIVILYGVQYVRAADILIIHIWCSLFMSLGLASGSWIMAERRVRLNLYRNLAGAASNIVLNLLMIPLWGAIGAAYATLISLIIAYFVFDFFCPPLRPMVRMKMQAITLLGIRS